jgi:hypothetical protein
MSTATASKPRRRVISHTMPFTLAMATPAVRMVVVHAYANREADGTWYEHDHVVYPVLAIVGYHEHTYNRRSEEDHLFRTAPTHDAMEELGWRYEGGSVLVEFDAVIHDPEYGLTDAKLALDNCSNGAYEIVPCPWPAAEDSERLAPVIERLRAAARDKVMMSEPAIPADVAPPAPEQVGRSAEPEDLRRHT